MKIRDREKQHLNQEYLPVIYERPNERSKLASKISLGVQPSKEFANTEVCKSIEKRCKYFKHNKLLRFYNKGEISQFRLQTKSGTTPKEKYKKGPSYLMKRHNSHERLVDSVVSSRRSEIKDTYNPLQEYVSSSQYIAAASTPKNYKSRLRHFEDKSEE